MSVIGAFAECCREFQPAFGFIGKMNPHLVVDSELLGIAGIEFQGRDTCLRLLDFSLNMKLECLETLCPVPIYAPC